MPRQRFFDPGGEFVFVTQEQYVQSLDYFRPPNTRHHLGDDEQWLLSIHRRRTNNFRHRRIITVYLPGDAPS